MHMCFCDVLKKDAHVLCFYAHILCHYHEHALLQLHCCKHLHMRMRISLLLWPGAGAALCTASAPAALGSAAGMFAVGAVAQLGHLLLGMGPGRALGTLFASAAGALLVRQTWRSKEAARGPVVDLESQVAAAVSPGRLKPGSAAGNALEIHSQSGRRAAHSQSAFCTH